jgi:hypothetical protein
VVEVPAVVEQRLPEGGFGTAPVADFNHLVEETWNPDNVGKYCFPSPLGDVSTISGHRLGSNDRQERDAARVELRSVLGNHVETKGDKPVRQRLLKSRGHAPAFSVCVV